MEICYHKCHAVGLNPWVETCPVCGCPNKAFDPKAQPFTFEQMHDYRKKQDEIDS